MSRETIREFAASLALKTALEAIVNLDDGSITDAQASFAMSSVASFALANAAELRALANEVPA
jgi:hypothetical protein